MEQIIHFSGVTLTYQVTLPHTPLLVWLYVVMIFKCLQSQRSYLMWLCELSLLNTLEQVPSCYVTFMIISATGFQLAHGVKHFMMKILILLLWDI